MTLVTHLLMSVNVSSFLRSIIGSVYIDEKKELCFKKDLKFGTAVASYQVEGAIEVDGREKSIWDVFCKSNPKIVCANYAANFYDQYESDLQTAASGGTNMFRLSISWPRVMKISENERKMVRNVKGIAFYRKLLTFVKERHMTAVVTMYHWDLPQSVFEFTKEGWLDREIVRHFVDYATLLFEEFGDLVDIWGTINQPLTQVTVTYAYGYHAPGRSAVPDAIYKAGHNILLSHAKVVELHRKLKKEKKIPEDSTIGLILNCKWPIPWNPNDESDLQATDRSKKFECNWFLEPIVNGDYPKIMRERLGSRLPKFTDKEKALLAGSSDIMMLNHYSTVIATDCNSKHSKKRCKDIKEPFDEDVLVYRTNEFNGAASSSLKKDKKPACPWFNGYAHGYYELIKYVHSYAPEKTILLTENGFCGNGDIKNYDQVNYVRAYLTQVHRAVSEGIKIAGYILWSLVDTYEWGSYDPHYGLLAVSRPESKIEQDYPTREVHLDRTPRIIADMYFHLAKTGCFIGLEQQRYKYHSSDSEETKPELNIGKRPTVSLIKESVSEETG